MQFHYVWVGGGLLPILFLTENKTMFCIFFHTVVHSTRDISCLNSFCSKSKHYTRVYNSVLNTYIFCDGDREALDCERLNYSHECSASTFNKNN